jgi:hypothetical protein
MTERGRILWYKNNEKRHGIQSVPQQGIEPSAYAEQFRTIMLIPRRVTQLNS